MAILQTGLALLTRDNVFSGDNTFTGAADGALGSYDFRVGDVADYAMIRFGDAAIGRTSYNVASVDLDGTVLFRNMGGPLTGPIEFLWEEGSGDTRFALATSAVGNATYNARSLLCAGPAPANSAMVTVGYWQGVGIFHNLVCDTVGSGAEVGVQGSIEIEGIGYIDDLQESTPAAGITFGTDGTHKLGFHGATPVVQPSHIADADGSLAHITTQFNQLLADLASQGLQAAA